MTKRERLSAVKKLDGDKAKKILAEIVGNCIEGGRKLDMRSTDILDSICDVLDENGLGR